VQKAPAVNAGAFFYLDHALQFHGDAHVAFDLEFAAHKTSHGVEFAVEQGLQVFQADKDGAVGVLVGVGNTVGLGDAVQNDNAVATAVKFQGCIQAAVSAHFCAHRFGH